MSSSSLHNYFPMSHNPLLTSPHHHLSTTAGMNSVGTPKASFNLSPKFQLSYLPTQNPESFTVSQSDDLILTNDTLPLTCPLGEEKQPTCPLEDPLGISTSSSTSAFNYTDIASKAWYTCRSMIAIGLELPSPLYRMVFLLVWNLFFLLLRLGQDVFEYWGMPVRETDTDESGDENTFRINKAKRSAMRARKAYINFQNMLWGEMDIVGKNGKVVVEAVEAKPGEKCAWKIIERYKDSESEEPEEHEKQDGREEREIMDDDETEAEDPSGDEDSANLYFMCNGTLGLDAIQLIPIRKSLDRRQEKMSVLTEVSFQSACGCGVEEEEEGGGVQLLDLLPACGN